MKFLREHRYVIAVCIIALLAPANKEAVTIAFFTAAGSCCYIYCFREVGKALYVFLPSACYFLGSMHVVMDGISKK
jgi:hypothetical protein